MVSIRVILKGLVKFIEEHSGDWCFEANPASPTKYKGHHLKI